MSLVLIIRGNVLAISVQKIFQCIVKDIFQDYLNQCPMPRNADQNYGIDPKCFSIPIIASQCRSIPITEWWTHRQIPVTFSLPPQLVPRLQQLDGPSVPHTLHMYCTLLPHTPYSTGPGVYHELYTCVVSLISAAPVLSQPMLLLSDCQGIPRNKFGHFSLFCCSMRKRERERELF